MPRRWTPGFPGATDFAQLDRRAISKFTSEQKKAGPQGPASPAWAGMLVFVFVEEEVLLAGVIGPDVLDGFERIALVLQLLQILYNFERCAGAHGEVNQLVFAGGPRSVFEVGSQFKCPIHGKRLQRAKIEESQSHPRKSSQTLLFRLIFVLILGLRC